MNAVITAGGLIDGDYAREAGTMVKALARIGETTMLERAIAAARGAGAKRVAVVGGGEVHDACAGGVDLAIDASHDGAENVLRALRAWDGDERLLYLTSDLPFVTDRALHAFIAGVPEDAIAMPIASIASFERSYPGAPPAGITLGGERVVNGGAFVVPAGSRSNIADRAAAFFAARKSPWAMARLLGPALLVRFALGRLGVAALEAYAARTLGVRAIAVRDSAPELCFDADGVAEYRYARERR